MPCYQQPSRPWPYSYSQSSPASSGSYATEAECLQACKEGACCEGTTCSVKPQCQCQGTGKTFKGVGTTCEPNPCLCCCEFLDARPFGPVFSTIACTSPNNRQRRACDPTPLTVTVSGVEDAVVADLGGALFLLGDFQEVPHKDLSFANTSGLSAELCGQGGLYVQGPEDQIPGGFWIYSSVLIVEAWFSPFSITDAGDERCGAGDIRLNVQIALARQWRVGAYNMPYSLTYEGKHTQACEPLVSYEGAQSMLNGKQVDVACNGFFREGPGGIFGSYAAETQNIKVSFSANPLP